MSKKILVFESDAGFAQELKSGFGQLGCETSVVEDANQGLQTAAKDKPDLILLSIELPRMNGFSVCNKLKRDAALKDVPLIIMSADSTEETFEQHRRLRTRAEDYVKKPISFATLLERIQPFVALSSNSQAPESTSDEAIVMDDDIEIEEAEVSAHQSDAPVVSTSRESLADADVNDFAEQAFGNLVEGPPPSDVGVEISEAEVMSMRGASRPPPSDAVIDSEAIEIDEAEVSEEESAVSLRDLEPQSAAPPTAISSQPPSRAPSVRPSTRPLSVVPRAADIGDVGKHREELEQQRARIRELEDDAHRASSKLSELEEALKRGASQDSEVQRLQRELDETKSKLATSSSGPAKGAGTAREFLDLREQLNKKDKEILEIRDQLSHKEKELLALRDGALALERDKADLHDTISELEKGAAEMSKAADAAKSDKEQASKRADDFKRKSDKLKLDLDAKIEELSAAQNAHAAAIAANEQQASAVAAAHEQALAEAREAQADAVREAQVQGARDIEAAAARTRAEVEAERDRALAAAESAAASARESAVASRESELNRIHEEALNSLRAELAQELESAQAAASKQLAARESELSGQLETQTDKLKTTSEALAARENTIRELRSDLEGKIEELEVLKKTVGDQATRNTALEALLSATKSSLDSAQQDLGKDRASLERARSKWTEDRASLERAKDALAAALAQIEEAEARTLD
ncbi:MAG TPA: response regulator [Polyangiaceae bacterium]|jgi:DNA-binding response OmpR family regulator